MLQVVYSAKGVVDMGDKHACAQVLYQYYTSRESDSYSLVTVSFRHDCHIYMYMFSSTYIERINSFLPPLLVTCC